MWIWSSNPFTTSNCVYLWQHLTTEGVDVAELVTDVPEGWTFLRQLPKKVWKTEVRELIVMCFNHLLETHAHMSSFAANISSLAKIANPETFNMVMKAVARPMIQVNVPEHYLSLVCKRIGVVQLLVMSIKFTCRYSSTWCCKDNPGHSTRIARGFVRYKR